MEKRNQHLFKARRTSTNSKLDPEILATPSPTISEDAFETAFKEGQIFEEPLSAISEGVFDTPFKEGDVVNLSLNLLVDNRVFKLRSDESLATDNPRIIQIADSIEATGQQQPIKVRPVKGENTFEIIFGYSRVAAFKLIAQRHKRAPEQQLVSCLVTFEQDDEKCVDAAHSENRARGQTNSWEQICDLRDQLARGVQDPKILQRLGWTSTNRLSDAKRVVAALPDNPALEKALQAGLKSTAAQVIVDSAIRVDGFPKETIELILKETLDKDLSVSQLKKRISAATPKAAKKRSNKKTTPQKSAAPTLPVNRCEIVDDKLVLERIFDPAEDNLYEFQDALKDAYKLAEQCSSEYVDAETARLKEAHDAAVARIKALKKRTEKSKTADAE